MAIFEVFTWTVQKNIHRSRNSYHCRIPTTRPASNSISSLLVQVGTELLNGNYTDIYTIATMDEKCENYSWYIVDKLSWYLKGRIAISWFVLQLAPWVSIRISIDYDLFKCCANCKMLMLQLGSLLNKMWSYFHSIFDDSVILTNIATRIWWLIVRMIRQTICGQ